jgi:hypothetical protein
MISKIIRLGLATLAFAYAIYLFTQGSIGNGIMMILLSGVFVLLYFRHEYMLIAFFFLRKGDMPNAKKWIDKIKNPDSVLVKKQSAYYYFLQGLCEIQTNVNGAEKNFRKALTIGLRFDHDKAMAKMSIAGAVMARGNKIEAQKLLAEAKKLDKNKILDEQLKMLNGQLAQVGQVKNYQQIMAQQGRGGFRKQR